MIRFLLICLVLLVGCSTDEKRNADASNQTDLSSLLTATTSESDLIEQLGPENVRRDSFHIGEGFFEPATVVYSDDPTRRAYVLWVDADFETPDWVRVIDEESTWTIAGVRMGMTLRELVELNRQSFQLTGFGWDFGGTIIGWNGGRLEAAVPGMMISARLGLPHDNYDYDEISEILGSENLSASHPMLQEINPVVEQLGIWLDR